MKAINIFAVLIGLTCSVASFAQSDYKCVVKTDSRLEDDGSTSSNGLTVGEEFVVDRSTGVMIGAFRNSNNFHEGNKPHVLDYGSSQQAFKAITIFQPKVSVDYLYVQEFSSSSEKPFMFVTGSSTYTGLCTSY